jgi:menaquinone-dependent protoporphyrinogen oxidase
MKNVLFVYATTDGHTYKILRNIEQNLQEVAKVQYYNVNTDTKELKLENYNYILIASPIRYGHFSKNIYNFINTNSEALNKLNASFISINLTSRKEGKDNPKTSGYLKKFNKKSLWQPKNIAMFAGKLDYPKYKFFDKYMIKLIMYLTGGETNTSKTVDYTNWRKVKEFSTAIKKDLANDK